MGYAFPQSLTHSTGSNQAPEEQPLLLNLSCSMPGHLVPDTACLCGGEDKLELLPYGAITIFLCFSQFQLDTSPLRSTSGKIFERANPGQPVNLLSNYPSAGPKMIVEFPGWGKIFPKSKKLFLKLTKNPF